MASVLVVDDDHHIGEVLGEILRTCGQDVRVARNGEEGLRRVAEELPDLVILDVEMPVLTGPDMAHVMFVTRDFLGKPYEFQLLLELVDRALAERLAPTPRRPS
jgi:FixJ family two-component response regulator